MRVLHVVPDSVAIPKHLFLGSTKDVRGRTEYLKTRGIPFDEIVIENRSDALLLKKLRDLNLARYTTVLFELPVYPASLRFLRRKFSQIKLLTRSINAEFYHRLHFTLARLQHVNRSKVLRDFKHSLSCLRLDFLCARYSDHVLSITQWEKDHYWRFMTGVSKVINVPYFLPGSYCHAAKPVAEKKMQCLCLMSTTQSTLPFLLDAAKRFTRLVEMLGRNFSEWDFYITGDFPANCLSLPKRVTPTGFLDTPFEIMAASRAVALLSDYGFGFKTKLLDAIQCKCYALVTKGLYQRLPVEVQPYCIVVDTGSVESFKNALEKCLEPYPEENPNEALRSQAFAALDEIFYGQG